MEPVVEKFLQGIPFAGMGTTLERNGLIGVVREMIKANKYTVDYILNYCESVGYQRKMAEEVFEELTGLSPKLIINNNEYYNAPIYVPACTIAWGIAKSKKDVAFYVVPGSYGYSVMEKNETEAPVEVTQTATIPEAIDELKKVAKNIQTLDKIITSKLLETEDIQSSANDIDQTAKPYFSDPIRELKKNFKDKVIDINAFEREAKKLVAEEKISLDEAEDLMNWQQDVINEDESYANEVLQHNEEWKPLEAEEDLSFDNIYEEFKAISSEDEDILGNKNKAEKLYNQNKSLFQNCDLLQCAERLYQLMLGFSKQEILGHSKVEKKMEKKSSDKDFEDAFENELVFDDSDNKAYFSGYEEYKFDIESDYQKMKEKALEVWKKINSSDKKADKKHTLSDDPHKDALVKKMLEVFEKNPEKAQNLMKGINKLRETGDTELSEVVEKNIIKKSAKQYILQYAFDGDFSSKDVKEKRFNNLLELSNFLKDDGMLSEELKTDDDIVLFNKNNDGGIYKIISASKNDIFKKDKVQSQVFETLKNTAKECGDEIWSNCFGQLVHIISYKPLENGYYEVVYESINTNDENIKFYEECENYEDFSTLELLPNEKIQASKKIKADMDLSNIPGVEFVWHGAWADPEIQYDGYSFSYWEIEDALYREYEDYHEKEEDFNTYVKNNIKFVLDDYIANGYGEKIQASKKVTSDKKQEDYNKAYNAIQKGHIEPDTNLKGNLLYSLFEEMNLDMDSLSDDEFDYWLNLLEEAKQFGNKKSASKKVTAENMTLDDMEEEEDKTETEKELDKINETPIDELLEDNTPLDYFEKETQDDKVDTINDVVSKCITEFSDKFKDFNKYDIKMLSYKTKILDPYTPTQDEMIPDNEINADAVLQVILAVNNKADDTDIKKLLVVFSITDGKMHWSGTVRDEKDNIVAFTEEGLDSIFQEPEEVTEDII